MDIAEQRIGKGQLQSFHFSDTDIPRSVNQWKGVASYSLGGGVDPDPTNRGEGLVLRVRGSLKSIETIAIGRGL